MALLEYALVKGINVIIERRAKTTVMRLKETLTVFCHFHIESSIKNITITKNLWQI